jgi:drug/metabolite transporter (DMT)-like permease
VTAVLLACASAFLFGGMTVTLRLGLRGAPDAAVATIATVLPALAVSLAAVVVEVARGDRLGIEHAWPYLLAGLLAPGSSQVLFTLAVRDAGPSRASVAVGTAPLVSVAIALAVLGEPARAPLIVGAVLVVAGGVALVGERDRPEHVRAVGLAYAGLCTVLFATRDNLVRHLAGLAGAPSPGVAVAATLLTGTAVASAWFARSAARPPAGTWLRFLPAGLLFGLSYVCLFEAYFRSRVTIVAPLVATESLWGVTLSVLIFRRTELVGRRLLAGAVLVVTGGALIGAFR